MRKKRGEVYCLARKKLKVYYPILQIAQRAAKLLCLKLAVTEAHLYDLHQTKESRLNTRKSVNTVTDPQGGLDSTVSEVSHGGNFNCVGFRGRCLLTQPLVGEIFRKSPCM